MYASLWRVTVVVLVGNTLAILPFQALLPGLLARMILEVRCPREAVLVMALLLSPVLLPAAMLEARLESYVFTVDEPKSDFSEKAGAAVAAATAGESDRNLGSRSLVETHSCHNSSWSVDVVACARVSAVPGVSATASSSASAPASLVVVAHARSTPMHVAHNSCSDTRRVQFRSGRRFALCLRGGGRGKFSAGRRCTGAGCRFTSHEATRHRYQAAKGRCGHTPSTWRFLIPNSRHLDVD